MKSRFFCFVEFICREILVMYFVKLFDAIWCCLILFDVMTIAIKKTYWCWYLKKIREKRERNSNLKKKNFQSTKNVTNFFIMLLNVNYRVCCKRIFVANSTYHCIWKLKKKTRKISSRRKTFQDFLSCCWTSIIAFVVKKFSMSIEFIIVMLYNKITTIKSTKQILTKYINDVKNFLVSIVKFTLNNFNCFVIHVFDHIANNICWNQCRKIQINHFHIINIV